jgi:hypothetical protein
MIPDQAQAGQRILRAEAARRIGSSVPPALSLSHHCAQFSITDKSNWLQSQLRNF